MVESIIKIRPMVTPGIFDSINKRLQMLGMERDKIRLSRGKSNGFQIACLAFTDLKNFSEIGG